MKKNLWRLSFLITAVLIGSVDVSRADIMVEFGPRDCRMNASIKYSVIGRYRAEFEKFKGQIRLDDNLQYVLGASLDIETASIQSNCRWCDDIVKSKTLLDAAGYPLIVFKTDETILTSEGMAANATLTIRGQSVTRSYPFAVNISKDDATGRILLKAAGRWSINRKDFGIYWHKFLDRGGIIVGNHITVDWEINSEIKPQEGP